MKCHYDRQIWILVSYNYNDGYNYIYDRVTMTVATRFGVSCKHQFLIDNPSF